MEDDVVDLAAQVSFYFVLSLVPFLIVLAAIVGWLPSSTLWQSFAQWITDYFPNRSRQAVFATILDLTRGYTGFLSFGLLAAIWSASSGFMSLMEALSIACFGDATRRFSESALDAAPRGVRGVVVRLSPTVHGDGDHAIESRRAPGPISSPRRRYATGILNIRPERRPV